tara:strand:- start:1114 stop:2016 length:903 start_codon:yes stop_codon:yes gene_type:complete
MAHTLWHIEPSFYRDFWKDKLMSGASAVQEKVVDPLFDRVMGTAPGIPARPWGGITPYAGRPPEVGFVGESGVPPGTPARPSTPTGPRSVADIVNNFKTPASLGLPAPSTAAPVAAPPTMPGLSEREQAIAAQVRASDMANGRSTGMNLATPPADPAFVGMMQGQPNPFEPSGSLTSIPIRATAPAASTARGYLPIDTLPRVKHSAPAAMGPGGLPADVRHTGAHTQYNPPTNRQIATPGLGRPPRPIGPFKKEIAEAAADEGPAATEQDKLRRMLKMMFLSDLIKGTEAPSPDYFRQYQ